MPRTTAIAKAKRKTVILSDRDAAIKEMNDDLRQHFMVIDASIRDVREANIRFHYQVGEICIELATHPEKYTGKNGTPANTLLAQALDIDPRTLTACKSFAEEYDHDDLMKLVSMVNPATGHQLNWGHVTYLLTVTDKDERDKFAQKAITEQLNPRTLHDEIVSSRGGPKRKGRPHEAPKSILAGVRQMFQHSQTWYQKYTNVWNGPEVSFFSDLAAADTEDISQQVLEKMGELQDMLEDMKTSVAEALKLTEETIRFAKKRRRDAEEEEDNDSDD